MRVKLVTDGEKFAIKKSRLFGGIAYYFDLASPGYWWRAEDRFFRSCWGDEDTARMWLRRLTA